MARTGTGSGKLQCATAADSMGGDIMLDSESLEEASSVFAGNESARWASAQCSIDPLELPVESIDNAASLRAFPHVMVDTLDDSRVASITPAKESK